MGTTADKLTYLNETKDKIKEAINITGAGITNQDTFRSYATKLKNRLVDIINNGTDVLYNNFPHKTGKGSELNFNNTLGDVRIKFGDFVGNTEQQTYSGKNLYNYNTLVNQTRLSYQIVNNELIITRQEAGGSHISNKITNLEVGQTYVIKCNSLMNLYKDNVYGNLYISGDASEGLTFVAEQNNYWFSIIINSNVIPNIGDTLNCGKIQLEKNSIPTEFEPYVGGKSSPNPDYPQELKSVTGRQIIEISDGIDTQQYEVNLDGKNLFNKNNVTTGSSFASNGTIERNQYTTSLFVQETYLKINNNSNYIFSSTVQPSRLVICEYDSNKTFIKRNIETSNNYLILNPTANTKYIRLCSSTNALDTLQFELGSQATSYVSYFEPVKLNKFGNYEDYIDGNINDWYINKYVGIINSYNGETITTDYMSTTGQLTTGATVYYGLTNSTRTKITNTELNNQLNALYNARSYEEETNIVVTGNIPMILDVTVLSNE